MRIGKRREWGRGVDGKRGSALPPPAPKRDREGRVCGCDLERLLPPLRGVSPLHPSTAEGRGSGRRGSTFYPPPPAVRWGSGFGALQAAPLRSLSTPAGRR